MEIPFFPQKNEHYCGPAVGQMILAAYGIESSQDALAREMKTPVTPHEGTLPKNLIATLRTHGLVVRTGQHKTLRTLAAALKRNELVLVCYTEPVEEWGHYSIVKEISDATIVLLDPDSRTGTTSMLLKEFERRWRDPLFTNTTRWAAFVALPPVQLQR